MRDTIAVSLNSPSASRLHRLRSLRWSVLRRDRSLPHLERKFYHFVMGCICFSLYAFFLTREESLLLLATIGGAFVLLDVFRLWFPSMNALALKLFGKIMRRNELRSITGNSFYVLGLFVVVAFFPKPIVLLSVIFLGLGDPIAAVVGSLYGRHKLIGKKSVEGAAANLVTTWLVVIAVGLWYFGFPIDQAFRLACVGAVISMVVELLPFRLDDNFTIPVSSAILLTLVNRVLPLW